MDPDAAPVSDAERSVPAAALAAHLARHRETVLQAWSEAVARDTELTSPDALSRTQFRDHIPHVLDEFEECLRKEAAPGTTPPEAYHLDNSVEHGEHRWKQGYDLREVILEWGHLHRCLLDALDTAAHEASLALTGETFAVARLALARLVHTAIADSAEQFALLQQKEATRTRGELEHVVAGFIDAGQRRVALWNASAHGLRGQLSIITSATTLLTESGLEESLRMESVEILQRGTATLKEMLSGALENVQTEAVHEECQPDAFDAATLLGGLCAASQPLARERRLILRTGGPESLEVEGDRGKVLRIAQNLLLNALAYTSEGNVGLFWREDDPAWWSFQVRDTGPGLPAAIDGTERREIDRPGGGGIGLSIVRRLVEVLGGRLEIALAPGTGTIVTVALPRRYAAT